MRTTISCLALLSLLACGGDDPVEEQPVPDAGAGSTEADAGHAGHGGEGGVGSDAAAVTADAGSDCTATIQLLDYALAPTMLEVASGQVVLCAVNAGKTPHDLSVRTGAKQELGRTPTLAPGQVSRLALTLSPGAHTMYCSVAGHESLGMTGPLMVR